MTQSTKKYNIKFFPFAPGIPWKTRGNYVVPELSTAIWENVLNDKQLVVVAHGGLFESFFSLSIIEAFNIINPGRDVYWTGNSKYESLVYMNGISKLSPVDIEDWRAKDYPVPIFLDKKDYAYINCLNNYIMLGLKDSNWNSRASVCQQIFRNSTLSWDSRYIPKIRTLFTSDDLEDWRKRSKFYNNKPYVLIFPDVTGMSMHTTKCLHWGPSEVKALSSLLYSSGYSLVVCTNNPRQYYDNYSYVAPANLDFVLYLISGAKAIISKEIDFLLMGLLLSDAKIISNAFSKKRMFSPSVNKRFLKVNNMTYNTLTLTPTKAYKKCLGLENDG